MQYIAAAIVASVAALAASYGNGQVISKALEGMARQPESTKALRSSMFIGVGMIEAVPIMAIVIAFMLVGK